MTITGDGFRTARLYAVLPLMGRKRSIPAPARGRSDAGGFDELFPWRTTLFAETPGGEAVSGASYPDAMGIAFCDLVC